MAEVEAKGFYIEGLIDNLSSSINLMYLEREKNMRRKRTNRQNKINKASTKNKTKTKNSQTAEAKEYRGAISVFNFSSFAYLSSSHFEQRGPKLTKLRESSRLI